MLSDIYAGLMSGTSLDAVDCAIVAFPADRPRLLGTASMPMPNSIRERLLRLRFQEHGEIDDACEAGIELARLYAAAVEAARGQAGPAAGRLRAIGAHGQTIRHRPERGYTVQAGNPALLAELTGCPVIGDFRSRDIAAGGQGAPLASAFHRAAFSETGTSRAIVNIGGIANVTRIEADGAVSGFDCGPGNALLDEWIERHRGERYDRDGAWAASGRSDPALLRRLLAEPYFALPPPKSTGRDRFHLGWLGSALTGAEDPVDVQATLLELTATTIARAVVDSDEVYLCGGGAYNAALVERLATRTAPQPLATTAALGWAPEWVEAAAFAWLARECLAGRPGNLPAVTGARGARVLGAIYPA
jgi:anhydro-N-acetylmuramic acid kinase